MGTDRVCRTSNGAPTSAAAENHAKVDREAKSGKEAKHRKEHHLVSPKLVFLKRKIKHINQRAEADRKSVLGDAITNTSIQLFVGIYSLLIFTRGVLRQYIPGIREHLRRQFALSFGELEFVSAVEKIGFVLVVIFVGYYGNKMHKPLGVLVGAAFCACGTILCACPYITDTTPGRPGNFTDAWLYYEAGLCQIDTNQTTTSKTQCEALLRNPDTGQAFSFFAGGNFIIGIGSTFLLILGFVYIEESTKKDTAPLYYGIILFLNGAGECLGIIAAWRFTELPYTLKDSFGLDKWDTGAWWLAFPILGTLFLSISLPLLMFPKWIVEPKWLTNRRSRRLKRWNYFLKVEQKLVNKIMRKQRRRKRKEENAKRKRERQKEQLQSSSTNRRESIGGTDREESTLSPDEAGVTDVKSHSNDAYESNENGSAPNNRDSSVDNETAISGGRPPSVIRVEAEIHVDVNSVTDTPISNENDDASDDESDEEELNTGPSSPGSGEPEGEVRSPAPNMDEDSIAELATDSSGTAPSRGVHFALNDEGEILAETRIEDILQMEEPPQEPAPLEDGESIKSDKVEKERQRRILGRRIQDLPKNLWFLLNRPVISLILASTALAAYSPAGYQATLPSYLSVQFAVYEPSSLLISGIPYTVGSALGTLLSGYVIYRKCWKLMAHVKIIITVQCVVIVLLLFGMIPTCNIQYFFHRSSGANVTSNMDCSSRCDCRQTQYEPICSTDGLEFPSGCVAGCRSASIDSEMGVVVYDECLCVPDKQLSSTHCNSLCYDVAIGYGMLVFLIAVFQNFGVISVIIICLRGISQKLRSLSLAFAVFVVTLAAFVPGVAVFRAIQAVSCTYEERDCLGDDVCWLYERDEYRYLQHGATSVFQLASVIVYIATLLVMRSKVKAAIQPSNRKPEGDTNEEKDATVDEPLRDDDITGRREVATGQNTQL